MSKMVNHRLRARAPGVSYTLAGLIGLRSEFSPNARTAIMNSLFPRAYRWQGRFHAANGSWMADPLAKPPV